MSIKRLLIANRGEIAIRIFRTARDMGINVFGVYPEDDASSLHVKILPSCHRLAGEGSAAYLDIDEVISAAHEHQVDAIHPGYGFLSENSEFAARCQQEGFVFVGPDANTLKQLSDKSAAKRLAADNSIPILSGLNQAVTIDEAYQFFNSLPSGSSMFIKAVAGGGGRGMRLVSQETEISEAFESAAREADAFFGVADLYVEQCMPAARHIEVQILGDGLDAVHFAERECSLQRRNQKIIEMAPAQDLSFEIRQKLYDAAIKMAKAVSYRGLGTFEFLVSQKGADFAFMEVNPRIQVEHTVTEEIYDIDLVEMQLKVASGATLEELDLISNPPASKGTSVQVRINAESFSTDGKLLPSGGSIVRHELPQGRGVRVESAAFVGWKANPRYDSLLSKIIISDKHMDMAQLLAKADAVLADYCVEGVETTIAFLRSILNQDDVLSGPVSTTYIDDNLDALLAAMLPLKNAFKSNISPDRVENSSALDDADYVLAPLPGTLIKLLVSTGDYIRKGQEIAILEAMKMEHLIHAPRAGEVSMIFPEETRTLDQGDVILSILPANEEDEEQIQSQHVDLDFIRSDLAALMDKKNALLDAARPDAVARRRKNNKNTIRENIDRLIDAGSFSEYGGLNLAAQRSRRSVEELEKMSPADGMVAGTASINADLFGEDNAACLVLGYDYTVFAGTQGGMNHKKTDRLFHLAEQRRLPIIFYGEGGGGRPGDTDIYAASTLDVPTFQTYARLSGLVPRIAIASGRCFAGNAALMGVSDILIATKDTSLGMGGPAMIEGGGLGVYEPEEVGPVSVQGPNGVIDFVCEDENEATDIARKLLSYFQGTIPSFQADDQRKLRFSIPENRLRVYDIRSVINILADMDSVLELKCQFAEGMLTGFLRIGGHPFGYIANNPAHLGGAIDADGSEKAARHMQLCDAFDIPILTLCDTPGFMVGPDAEKTALVRKTSRLFAAAGSITVPVFTLVLRKGYGLGAQAMAGGSMHAPFATFAWPTGEMGPMGLEGAVRLGFKKELAAIEDEKERQEMFESMVAKAYENGKAINAAAYMEIDDVIDPATSRDRLLQALKAAGPAPKRQGKKRTFVDTW